MLAVVKSRLRQGPVAGVVGTLMTNLAFEHALAELDVPFARAAVGDRYVLEMLREKGWLFGGENSGHILSRQAYDRRWHRLRATGADRHPSERR